MLGLKSSLGPVIEMIKRTGASSWTQTTFCQGRTTRWAVAWTFLDSIQFSKLTKKTKEKKQPPLSFPISCENWTSKGLVYSISAISDQIMKIFNQLEVTWIIIELVNFLFIIFFILDRNKESSTN